MPLSPFRKKAFVGLDLGHFMIKLVQVERAHNGWKVVRFDAIETPPGAVRDGVVVDQQAMAGAIRQLLKRSGSSATTSCIAVAGGSVVVRAVRIPKMPEATLRKSIKYEAGRYVPSSVEDSYVEFEIIGDADESQMDVLIVAAPRDLVESRVKACEVAGLEVEAVDVEAFAIYRALIEADADPTWLEKTVALVDIGSTTTNVSVISKGVFAMTRAIPHAGANLTDALKAYFKLEDADAEQGKAQLDFGALVDESSPIENPPLRVLQPHIDELIREIRRSLNYYQSQQTESGGANPVSQMVVCGGGANLKGLDRYFEHKLGLPVSSLGIFDNPRFSWAGTSEQGSGLELAVASGLAMRAYPRAA